MTVANSPVSTTATRGNGADPAPQPQVTIVVVPRERFSCTRQSLESIYAHTTLPFKLVYVDGNSPRSVQRYLQKQAAEKNFQLIRTNVYLYPNQARNIGLQAVDTPYLVFFDNDVIVSPGWLEALVTCAEETGAAVVGPLMCQHEPIHHEVHFAGGESHVWEDKLGQRRMREKMYDQGKTVGQVRDRLSRTQTELAEFHCVLVRTAIFEQIHQLDEQMINTKEHLDFCMTVQQAGGTVYFEPDSLVTYLPGRPQNFGDVHYYMLRWSNAWTLDSLNHFRQKWNLMEDSYFKTKYKKLGWRRHMTLVKPVARKLALGREIPSLINRLMALEARFNTYLTDRHRQQLQQVGVIPTPTAAVRSPQPSPASTPANLSTH
jgi:GT2 family glycosyltransferase